MDQDGGRLPRLALLAAVLVAPASPTLAASTVATNVTGAVGSSANPLDKVSQRKVVRDASGYTYVVYTKRVSGQKEVWIARGTGGTWSNKCLVGSTAAPTCLFGAASQNYLYPAIDINAARNEIHVALLHATSPRILYLKNRSLANWNVASAWTTAGGGGAPEVPVTGVLTNTAPAIAVDSSGFPHIAYLSQDAGLRKNVFYTRYTGSSWATAVNVSAQTTCTDAGNATCSDRDPSIDIGYGDVVHVSYLQDDASTASVPATRVYYARVPGPYTTPSTRVLLDSGDTSTIAYATTVSASDIAFDVWVAGGFYRSGANPRRHRSSPS